MVSEDETLAWPWEWEDDDDAVWVCGMCAEVTEIAAPPPLAVDVYFAKRDLRSGVPFVPSHTTHPSGAVAPGQSMIIPVAKWVARWAAMYAVSEERVDRGMVGIDASGRVPPPASMLSCECVWSLRERREALMNASLCYRPGGRRDETKGRCLSFRSTRARTSRCTTPRPTCIMWEISKVAPSPLPPSSRRPSRSKPS